MGGGGGRGGEYKTEKKKMNINLTSTHIKSNQIK